ncbi:MAG: hypothetical protein H0T89_36270 [Deltaproteobacteria bacterium]|nr:hypothetical protein [Deltaproteobacteria bacterium]MDQ3298264.1 PKD domain-containing protein [Myxococcota bacterium]
MAIIALVAACNGFEGQAQPLAGAQPHANAGTGSFYPMGTTVTLDGSLSFDPDGTIRAYRWAVRERPPGTSAVPDVPDAAIATLTPDDVGTYVLELQVTDDSGYVDTSELRIVSTGAITSVDAGPGAGVAWLATAQLSGSVTNLPGKTATYVWSFVSRPAGSNASLQGSATLTPTFVADATGMYVIALEARFGDETREATVTIEATATGVSLGTGGVAYTYSKVADRIVYVRGTTSAEVVRVDPSTGTQTTLAIGSFTPRSITIDQTHEVIAVGGPGRVARVAVRSNLVLIDSRAVPGCTAAHVTMPSSYRIDCWPVDGDIEPISSVTMSDGVVTMSDGVVTQIDCPVKTPYVTYGPPSWIYMVDGASTQFYVYDASSTPPLQVISSGSLAGHAPPVIAAGTNQPYAVTGNGLAVNPPTMLRYDLATPVSAGVYSALRGELAIASGSQLKIYDGMGSPLKLSAALPTVNGVAPTVKLMAYNDNGFAHRLIIVAGTTAGDVVYTVAR